MPVPLHLALKLPRPGMDLHYGGVGLRNQGADRKYGRVRIPQRAGRVAKLGEWRVGNGAPDRAGSAA